MRKKIKIQFAYGKCKEIRNSVFTGTKTFLIMDEID